VVVIPEYVKVVGVPVPPTGPPGPINTGYGVDAVTGIIFLNNVAPAPPPAVEAPSDEPPPPPPTNKTSINPVAAGVKVLAPVVVKACTV
jgi:hypothetical protein